MDTAQLIAKKFVTGDSVGDPYICKKKLVQIRPRLASAQISETGHGTGGRGLGSPQFLQSGGLSLTFALVIALTLTLTLVRLTKYSFVVLSGNIKIGYSVFVFA